MTDSAADPVVDKTADPMLTSLLAAARGEVPARIPVWFMRQAGRSLPEYHEARGTTGMIEACLMPELAAEITCQPVRRHDVDAAVFFSDIVVPMKLAGVDVEIAPGVGPVFGEATNSPEAITRLTSHRITDLEPITRAVQLVVAELGARPVIAFAGAPFTLAAYLVHGRPSKDHLAARALMHADPAAWDALMSWCADRSAEFLLAQLGAGARVMQLFDSWVGSLSEADYRAHVMPYSARVLNRVAEAFPDVPRIHFGTNTAHLLPALGEAGATAVGVDHRTPLSEANALLGGRYVLQGNLDPALLFAGEEALQAAARRVVAEGSTAPGHIVNLGHGVPPNADAQVLTDLVAYLHSLPVPTR
ncbi:uroporphyrinogen decarboxylase [Bowdeniella nasicola]|uniref:Uroporphyrinogen decarboxylase n=1 Tax=Bowdeniella nasicola TaxID=208480 RepID=A0A1Q5Q3Z1_9ACTO|nr:uroporphyrinogen decarboxylase [Bowdeniella nasicola]